MSYIKGESRDQGSLFPTTLDELVPANHLVRVIEAYVARLDLRALGFTKSQVKGTGRPPYDPADLLKLYLYGYLNQVRSSRRLERECGRNVELMWLLNRLAPDFKTIADFRRENGEGFVAVCAGFVQFCRAQRLLAGELVAIDGSKFQAVASKRRAITAKQLEKAKAKTAARVAEYLEMLSAADGTEAGPGKPDAERAAVEAALVKLRDRARKLAEIEALMHERGVSQHVEGEEEARLMRSGMGRGMVAYNVQSAVDGEHGLIVHHELTNEAADNRQLQPMSEAAKGVLAQDALTVVADAGYSNGEQFEACEQAGITPLVPLNRAVNNQGDGTLYGKDAFVYDAQNDSYRCPAGEELTRKQIHRESRSVYYRTAACGACPLKARCTEGKARTVTRHFHEDAFARMSERLAAQPDAMAKRRSIVEHPFGGIKCHVLGNGRLLLRHLQGARTEMALAVLAYNFRRASNIMGARMLAALT